jgi:hypothetical protein
MKDNMSKLRFWQLLSRLRDPLAELPTREEHKTRLNLQIAENRIVFLKRALAGGAAVEEDLEKARVELAELKTICPHGAQRNFLVLCVWWIVTLAPLACLYLNLRDVFAGFWGNPENWYLQAYRPVTAWAWRTSEMFASSTWCAVIPALILLMIYVIQRSMFRWHARAMIKATFLVETAVFVFFLFWLFNLFSLPLLTVRE